MEGVKGFKVFNSDWTCRGFEYQVGQTYEGKADICNTGFHFCKKAKDCFNYYEFNPNNKVAEVIALGEVQERNDKCCTSKIHIVRELSWQEVLTLVNTGINCTGLGNSGDNNSGNRNSGNRNSGNCNSGSWNSGYWNSGDRNKGGRNAGCRNKGGNNSGDYNSGDYNSGDYNSGSYNSGNYNSGDHNSGYYNGGWYNSGNWNNGNRNSGDWNNGNHNNGDWNNASQAMGCFNTLSQKLKFFDQETDMTLEQWKNSKARRILNSINFKAVEWIDESKMTDEEKAEHPEHKTTGGYLKGVDKNKHLEKWWNNLTETDKATIKKIPNFDAEKFFKITGIKA